MQAVATYSIWSGKVYMLIGILGASICPILDLLFDRNLMLESDNLGLYIGIQVGMILINGTLHMAVFAFFDVARVDYKRRSYLMDVLNSTIQACDGIKFNRPELIIIPLFNFLDQRSILTWLDVRSVFITAGARYALRIELYLGIFIIIDILIAVIFCIRLIIEERTPFDDGVQLLAIIYIIAITIGLFLTLF